MKIHKNSSSFPRISLLAIGHLVPEDLAERLFVADRFPGVQTLKFQRRLAEALLSAGDTDVQWLSSPPVTDWSPLRWLGLRKWRHRLANNGRFDIVMPVINIVPIKQICVLIGCFLGGLIWGLQHFGCRKVILLADAFGPHIIAALIIGRIFRCPVVGTITDLPGLIDLPDSLFKRLLRPLDRWLIHMLLRKLEGLIVLSEWTHHDFFPTIPYLLMEGFAEDCIGKTLETSGKRIKSVEDFVVLYTGMLSKAYGLELLIETMQYIDDPHVKLWVLGKGEDVALLEAAATDDPRICYFGFVESGEVGHFFKRASVLVNPRPADQTHSRYSFPSKILEYMATDKPVITTRFPSLPAEYEPYLLIPDSQTPEGLAAQIIRAKLLGPERLAKLGQQSRRFVLNRAAVPIQGDRIHAFIKKIMHMYEKSK